MYESFKRDLRLLISLRLRLPLSPRSTKIVYKLFLFKFLKDLEEGFLNIVAKEELSL